MRAHTDLFARGQRETLSLFRKAAAHALGKSNQREREREREEREREREREERERERERERDGEREERRRAPTYVHVLRERELCPLMLFS